MGIGEEATTANQATDAAAEAFSGTGAGPGSQTSAVEQVRANAADGLERPEETLTDLTKTRISLLRNVRYHEDREAFFTLLNRVMNLAVLLSGTAVVASLTQNANSVWITQLIAVGTTVIGAVQLIFDWSRKQFIHETLRVRFLELLGDLTESNIVETQRGASKLIGQEPPTYYAVDTLAFNAAMKAAERPAKYFKIVGLRHRRARNILRFTNADFAEAGTSPPRKRRFPGQAERS